jgi:hypothetical protein
MKVEIKPYAADHGIEIMQTVMEPNSVLPEQMQEAAYYNGQHSEEAYTLFIDDKPMLSGGFFLIHEGFAEGWILVSEEAREFPIKAVLTLRRYMKDLVKKYNLIRLQAKILKGFVSGNRLATILGFTLETPEGMQNYGHNGETYMLYSLARD